MPDFPHAEVLTSVFDHRAGKKLDGYANITVRAGRKVKSPGGDYERFPHEVQVSVSPTGRSVRVFVDHEEVTTSESALRYALMDVYSLLPSERVHLGYAEHRRGDTWLKSPRITGQSTELQPLTANGPQRGGSAHCTADTSDHVRPNVCEVRSFTTWSLIRCYGRGHLLESAFTAGGYRERDTPNSGRVRQLWRRTRGGL